VNIFSGGRENGLRDEHVADMRVAHGDAKTFRERSVNIAMVAREGICLLKMCIFYSLDRRSEHFFGWT
jgi:hypothetical protein